MPIILYLQDENEVERLSSDERDLGIRWTEVARLVCSDAGFLSRRRKELQLSSDDGEVVSPVTVAVAVTRLDSAAACCFFCCCKWRCGTS